MTEHGGGDGSSIDEGHSAPEGLIILPRLFIIFVEP